ncbi:MAG: competence protein CoiA family protein [Promethearchaeota archaeon]
MIEPKLQESESFEHLKIKEYFYKNIPCDNEINVIKKEAPIGNRKADIYCQLANGKHIVVEIQHSMILTKDLLQRTKEYNENDCYVLWIFNGSSFERYPKIEDNIPYLSFEKCSHMLYRGRVYYINMTEYGIHSPVYPLHFANFYEKESSNYGFRYYRKSTNKKVVIPSSIPSLKFKIFKNKGYKLAGFYDENVKKSCIQEIKQFLVNYEIIDNEINGIKKLNPRQKKLFIIMMIYGQQYGLHLIYSVLTHLKLITRQDFRYMSIVQQYLFNNH